VIPYDTEVINKHVSFINGKALTRGETIFDLHITQGIISQMAGNRYHEIRWNSILIVLISKKSIFLTGRFPESNHSFFWFSAEHIFLSGKKMLITRIKPGFVIFVFRSNLFLRRSR